MMTYEQDINELTVTKSLKLLRDGFKHEFATFAFADERMIDLLHELSIEFVDANIPITKDDHDTELAMMLLESVDLIAR
jgi:hypothetical protein